MDVPVVLSTQLSFDEGGAYTGEIRRALEKAEFGYRIINRIFPSYDTVVPSTVRLQKVRTEAKRIMNDHGGDVLVYGAVGAKPNTISIRFFGREPGGYIERGIEIDLGDVAWSDKVIRVVEAIATESGLEQVLGGRGIGAGMSLEEFMDASERKLLALNQRTDSEFLKERSGLGIEAVQIGRAKTGNDVITLRQIRETVEDRVGKTPRAGESRYQKVRRLGLADLYMVEGLMEGNTEKIEGGMRIAIQAGAAMLDEAMREDKTPVQKPGEATFPHWLLMTILVLACDDREAIRHLEDSLVEHCGGAVEQRCMAPSDALRMLLPLTVLNSDPDVGKLKQLKGILAGFRDFGLGTPDHWQDPFLHARRLVTKRLAAMEVLETGEGMPVRTNCPSLLSWMHVKGWYRPGA